MNNFYETVSTSVGFALKEGGLTHSIGYGTLTVGTDSKLYYTKSSGVSQVLSDGGGTSYSFTNGLYESGGTAGLGGTIFTGNYVGDDTVSIINIDDYIEDFVLGFDPYGDLSTNVTSALKISKGNIDIILEDYVGGGISTMGAGTSSISMSFYNTVNDNATGVVYGSSTAYLYYTSDGGFTITQEIKLDTSGVLITDSRSNIGLIGATSYSPNYTDYSYVQKEWIDNQGFLTQSSASLNSLSDVTITSPTDGQVLTYDNTSSEWINAAASGGGTSTGGNATVDNFYYQVSNSVDTRPVFTDDYVTINWDETGNDLEFEMKVAPANTGGMRSSAYVTGGSVQNTYITQINNKYDIYSPGVSAGARMDAIISPEDDDTYPLYNITVYNTGESYKNSILINRTIKN